MKKRDKRKMKEKNGKKEKKREKNLKKNDKKKTRTDDLLLNLGHADERQSSYPLCHLRLDTSGLKHSSLVHLEYT